jgi:mannosyltransferase OCH1-like enzyme
MLKHKNTKNLITEHDNQFNSLANRVLNSFSTGDKTYFHNYAEDLKNGRGTLSDAIKQRIESPFDSEYDDQKGGFSKILHRVYFENYAPFHDPFLHYLETWTKELPNYEVMRWGHNNVGVFANEWMERSAKANDPVFLSEYVRWDVLKKYGGIYLDSDCEVLNGSRFDSLVEELMDSTEYDAFLGVEEFFNGHPTAQTVAAKKGSALVEFMHDMYNDALSGSLWHWRSERGLIGPQLISLYFREHGLVESKGFPIQLKEPIIVGRVKIYPQDYFSPKFTTTGTELAVSENTCIYHLFANLNVLAVDPLAEQHRRQPMLFKEYCQYLSDLSKKNSNIRKLHRIYFGFDGKPDPYERYLETWSQQLPGYEICHWNASNLPIDNCHFSRLMFDLKDHAFLSDYFRWWILREHGGIYLDADVEIVNGELFDQIIGELDHSQEFHALIGIDSKEDGWYTAHSMACKKGSDLAKFMCETYESLGAVSLWRRKIFYLMAPQLTSLYFATHGWNPDGMGSLSHLETPTVVAGVKIYPQEWFSPMKPHFENGIGSFVIDSYTDKTCICHHFSCSWHDEDSPYKAKSSKGLLLNELVQNLNNK